MTEEELLLNMGVPCIQRAADAAGIPPITFQGVSRQAQASMAGNAMHVPSVGAILIIAMVFVRAR